MTDLLGVYFDDISTSESNTLSGVRELLTCVINTQCAQFVCEVFLKLVFGRSQQPVCACSVCTCVCVCVPELLSSILQGVLE